MPSASRVLLAEDDAITRSTILAYIDKSAIEVTVDEAANGQEALSKFDHSIHDCVVSDVEMPGKDGISLCEHIKAISDTPFIVHTGKSLKEIEGPAAKAGADEIYIKNGSMSELVEEIAKQTSQTVPAGGLL
jgi:two-component system OmpR family response regulator